MSDRKFSEYILTDELCRELDVSYSRLVRAIHANEIKPVARVGMVALYDPEVVPKLREIFSRIDARFGVAGD